MTLNIPATDALDVLYQAIRTRLANGSFPWGQRVYSDIAYVNAPRPYIVFTMVAGGALNEVRAQDGRFEINMQAFTDSAEDGMRAAAVLAQQFADQGELEHVTNPVTGNADWCIVNIIQGRRIHMIEPFNNTQNIFRDGHIFAFRMEAR